MPQMAPLSWLSLYFMFTVTLILFCIVNYYMYMPSTPTSQTTSKKENISLNWKW
uniref:ATP synthase complex subunit 8 n=1 Tax=Xanthochlorus tibetensis TaxID=2779315 RepID=A0A7S6NI92_9MUSC|nr:ATP synthase F0 subunit 8 [Xanthochlorus tibetensis]QOL12453.1 ATP synthase F0 subunit 8 [Xanthochlorus tibetensis]